jgi:small subunit ribosomal protein S7e
VISNSTVQQSLNASEKGLKFDETFASFESEFRTVIVKLKITDVKDVISEGIRIFIVAVPYKQISAYHHIQTLLVGELEHKLSVQMIVVARRRVFPKTPIQNRRFRAIHPVGRTLKAMKILKAVQEALLQNVVYPASIVGKRIY